MDSNRKTLKKTSDDYIGKHKKTRKELFLIEMDHMVPWKGLIALVEPHYPKDESGKPSYSLIAAIPGRQPIVRVA